MIQIRLQVSVLLIVAALSATALGSAIKGGLEHPPTKGAALEGPAAKGRVLERTQQQLQRIEGPIEEPLPREQLKASQEELQQVEELRSPPSKTSPPARKLPEPIRQEPIRQEQFKQEQFKQEEEELRSPPSKTSPPARKLPEPIRQEPIRQEFIKQEELKLAAPAPTQQQKFTAQEEVLLEKSEENNNSKTRYEARPQFIQTEQVREEAPAAAVAQAPAFFEQQRATEYDRQEIELRQPAEQEQQRRLPESSFVQQQKEEATADSVQQRAEAEPYSFSYAVDGSSRSESGDTKGVVRGQYTLQAADGGRRIVDYIADQDGFRASVNTNEFGTEARSPASVALRSSQPLAEDITLRLEGKTRESLQQQQAPIQQVYEQYRETASASVKGAPLLPAAPAPLAPVKGLQAQPLLLPQPALQEQYQEPIPAAVKSTRYETKYEAAAAAAPALAPAPLPALVLAPAARKEPAIREQQQQQLQEPIRALEESNKSAELLRREPKAFKSAEQQQQQSRVVKELPQLRTSTFESATAHREYRALPVVVVHPSSVGSRQVVRQHNSVAPAAVRYQPPVVAAAAAVRSPLVRQYPVSPVQAAGYRRYPVVAPVVVPERRDPRVSFYSPSSPSAVSASAETNDEQPNGFDSRSA